MGLAVENESDALLLYRSKDCVSIHEYLIYVTVARVINNLAQ